MSDRRRKKAALLKALVLNPHNIDSLCELGWLCRDGGELHSAELAFRQALRVDPESLSARHGLAATCYRSHRIDEGIRHVLSCIEQSPKNPDFWSLLSKLKRAEGLIEEAIRHTRRGIALAPADSQTAQRLLYQLLLSPDVSPIEVRQEHEAWAATHAACYYPSAPPTVPHLKSGERLRVGYVSPDWRKHPMAQLTESFLRHHDRARFEVFCYSCCRSVDPKTQTLSRVPEHWVEAGKWDDTNLFDRIQKDGIHILVDLAGHTRGGRPLLFARQPAPVQVTFLGYPATTGISTIAFRMTDALADPPGMTDAHCTERLVRLAESGWCFTPANEAPPVNSLPAAKNKRITFGNFANFSKGSHFTLALWARTLQSVPGSRLLLRSLPFDDAEVRARMSKRFAALGIEPERVEMRGWDLNQSRHLAAYHEVDIALDTFPYHGTVTTCEALHMGVPVVSLAGTSHVSRVGVSLLTTAGLADACLAFSADDFVKKASCLAADLSALARSRHELRPRLEQSVLMDGVRYTRGLEMALRDIWTGASGHPRQ